MATSYAIGATRLLTVPFILQQVWSLPHTNTSSPTTISLAVSDSTCHNTTSSTPNLPDQTFLSTTTFGVFSIILAFGSLIVGIVGILQYRQRKTTQEAAKALALVASATYAQPVPFHPLYSPTLRQPETFNHDVSSSPESPESLVAKAPTPSDLSTTPLACDITISDEFPTTTSSTTLVPPVCTTSARVIEEEPVDQVQADGESVAIRPVHQLRFRNSVRHANKDEVGFGGCYRTFTF